MTTPEPATADETMSGKRPRGWVSLYLASFVLMLLAGATVGIAAVGFLKSTGLMWVSIALSAASIVVALVGLMLPRRR